MLWLVAAVVAGAWVHRHVWITSVALPDTLGRDVARWVPLPTDGRAVQQSLTVDVRHLDGLCVALRREGHARAGVLVELRAGRAGQRGPVLWREIADVDDGAHCFEFGPAGLLVPDSGELWLGIRQATAAPAGEQGRVLVPVAAVKALQQEQLLVSDVEVWGDLLVKLHARQATRAAREAWPAWLPVALAGSPPVAAALTACLWAGAFVAAGLWIPAATLARQRRAQRTRVRARLVLIVVILTGTTAIVGWLRSQDTSSLVDRLAFARLTSSAPRLGHAIDIVDVDLGDGRTRALFTLPETEVEWAVPSDAAGLTTAIGLRQEAWTLPGDGATFTVLARYDIGDEAVLHHRHLDPFGTPADRGWHDVSVTFDDPRGRPDGIVLRVSAGPSGNAVRDAAMWREPAFVRR